ncbi:MAG: protein kinase [Deltaproteobacteria bacterium]|nr:protein kinase [Deltaproteobacteria bacterium]
MQIEAGIVVAEHFQLEELIGRGGMGSVWRARDLHLGRVVAIKILHTDLRSDPSLRERFAREARMLASIEHPAIVPIFHLGVISDGTAECPCIVMPLVRGLTLSDTIAKRGRLPLSESVGWMRALLEPLGVAHAMGIVHRDLKPQNIVLEEKLSGGLQLRLLDFGIAKDVGASPSAGSVMATRAGMLLGTPEYMSPEQVRDPSAVDGRADLWAASVVFFEMLTGEMPFASDSSVGVLAQVLSGQSRSASGLVSTLPPRIDALFAKLFAPTLATRPRTASEMLKLLEEVDISSLKTAPLEITASVPASLPQSVPSTTPDLPPSSVPSQAASLLAPASSPATPLPMLIHDTVVESAPATVPRFQEVPSGPQYFGAMNYDAAPSAMVPAQQTHHVHAVPVPTHPTGAAPSKTSTNALVAVAIIIPVLMVLMCALSVLVATR